MPTGYTAGIIDGKIKNFKQFATLCMRAFGATIHMRDDGLDAPYEPRTPTDYHTKAIAEANDLLKKANELSDEDVVKERKEKLLADKKYYLESISKTKQNLESLDKILKDVEEYEPPTSEHTGIKDFMINQIKETLKFDGSTRYAEERLSEITKELENINAAEVRKGMIEQANKDLGYHTEEQNKELERCANSNKWVEEFLHSLDNQPVKAQ